MTVLDSQQRRAAARLSERLPHAAWVLLFYAGLYTLFFAPVIFSSRFLAPGDAFNYYFPNFYAPRVLWNPYIMSGFPLSFDPQAMAWYPPSLIFAFIFHTWDGFVIAAYILASSFTYGYIYTLTESRTAATFGGIVFGMSGFMMAHFGHVTMVQCAAWLPLVIWSLEKLWRQNDAASTQSRNDGSTQNRSLMWLGLGASGVALSILAGHPQIFTYGFYLFAAYAVARGLTLKQNRVRYFTQSALVLILGVGMALVQLLPAYELARLSLRAEINYETFTSLALPLAQVPTLLFPMLFGGEPNTPYHLPVFGASGGPTELNGYIGLLPALLSIIAIVAAVASRRQRFNTIFWLCYGALALTLALEHSPLAPLAFHAPALNKFRAPARHFVELAFAVSVLTGLGTAAVVKKQITTRAIIRVVIAFAALLIVGLIVAAAFFTNAYAQIAAESGIGNLSLLPYQNPATGVPLVLLIASALSLIWWSKQTDPLARKILIGALLVCDLGSFGWFGEWRYRAPQRAAAFALPSHVARYRQTLDETNQRLLPVRGSATLADFVVGNPGGTRDEISPNLSMFWRVPTANGYTPLMLTRTSEFLNMGGDGSVGAWADDANQSLNLLAVRYITVPRSAVMPSNKEKLPDQLNLRLGAGCGSGQPEAVNLNVPQSFETTRLNITSSLGCSTQIPDGAEVLRVTVNDIFGNGETQTLRAGRDTSEWAFDCAEIRPVMKHHRAPVAETHDTERAGQKCEVHDYTTTLQLSKASKIKNIELRWTGGAAAITINSVKLTNDTNGSSRAVIEASGLLESSARWRHVEDIHETSIYENLSAMPRAWLVPQVRQVTGVEALQTIHTSHLPDGSFFDPARTALIETAVNFPDQSGAFDAKNSNAQIERITKMGMEIETSCATPAFLVSSEIYYPDWHASIDGKETMIYQTDYALRGVAVPAGNHRVNFRFMPRSFYLGAVTSFTCLLITLIFLLSGTRRTMI